MLIFLLLLHEAYSQYLFTHGACPPDFAYAGGRTQKEDNAVIRWRFVEVGGHENSGGERASRREDTTHGGRADVFAGIKRQTAAE